MAQKFVRKHYFINKELQGRYIFSFMVPMLILILFISIVMFFSTRTVIKSTERLIGSKIHSIIRSQKMFVEDEALRHKNIVNQLEDYALERSEGESSEFSRSLLFSTSWVLLLGLIIVIIEIGLLTVFVSHKIAGPIYRLTKFAEAVKEGDLSTRIFLRKGDQLQDTADKFNSMLNTVEGRIKETKELIDGSASDDEKVKKARDLLNQFKYS